MQPEPFLRSSPYQSYPIDPLQSDVVVQPREKQLLDLVIQGYSNRAIAAEMRITSNTVNAHLDNLAAKLALRSSWETAMCRRAVLLIWWERVRGTATPRDERGAVIVPGARELPKAAQNCVVMT